MSAALESVTRRRLDQFRRRQKVLLATKGISLALVVSVAVLMVVVLIDATMVIDQGIRWFLSLTIYATLMGWLLVTLSRLWQRDSLTATARAFEQRDPRLHEQLLAAVELAEETPSNQSSSSSFRSLVQQQVARTVAPVRIADLLPWKMVASVLLLALICIGVVVGLAFVPQLHWPHRIARALLPGANLGRISRFDIEVITPDPASTLLPQGDVAAIEARVRGPLPDEVILETRAAGQSDSLVMRGVTRPVSEPAIAGLSGDLAAPTAVDGPSATAIEIRPDDLVYTANLTLDAAEIEYRVIAEDAHTPWHRLTTRNRPRVTQFKKVITPPAYSGLAPRELVAEDGDVEALKGSRVRLEITCDQPIKKAWLSLNMAEATEATVVDLQPAGQGDSSVLVGEIVANEDFSYRVHLEAAETSFTNAFSTEYRVRAVVDAVPHLTWVTPESSMLVVEPNQLLPLTVHIADELPLAELSLVTSINGEPPVAQKLEPPAEADTTFSYELDLLAMRPRLGDTLRVLVEAKDRLGQPSTTSALELLVSTTAVDPERQPATEQRIELANQLRQFSERVQPQLKRVRELHEQFNQAQSDGNRAEIKQTAIELSQQARTKAKELREKVAEALKLPQDSVSLAELERTGQVLARIEHDLGQTLENAAEELDAESQRPEGERQAELRDRANRLRSATEQLADAAGVLDRRFREFIAHDVLAEIARGMSVVRDFQQQLAARSEEIPPAQLRRQQSVVARQLRELEQVMIDRSPLLREGAAYGIRSSIEWAGQMAERIERASSDRDENPNFKEFTKQVFHEVQERQNVMGVDGGLPGEINNGRKELDARSQNAAETLAQLAKTTAEANAVRLKSKDPANEQPNDQKAQEARELIEQLQPQFEAGIAHLQHRKELQQARGDHDAAYVNDLGNAIRATKLLLEDPDAEPTAVAEQLKSTAAALKRLEAIHNVGEAAGYLNNLEETERWLAASPDARIESPRAWDALQQRLEQAARAVRESGIDPKLAAELDSLRWSRAAAEAGEKIVSRRWSAEDGASAQAELSELHEQLDSIDARLAVVAQAARADLSGIAPSVPELARRAAEKTERLQQQTAGLSKAAAADEIPDLKSQLDQLSAEQQSTTDPINDLRDALSEMASVQDLLQADQREVARDADTSQQIIDKANEQIAQSLAPAAAAESPAAAADPLAKAATTQGEATAALEQIADHFEKLQAGDLAAGELAQSRQSLQQLASQLDTSAMDEWYKTADMLGKLAGGDPEQVLKRLEDELNRNVRMREELSDISKQAVDQSVKSLRFSAEQERSLQSQIEQSDPEFAVRKTLLQNDLQAANERLSQWMQHLASQANSIAGRAGAREQQKQVSDLQEQLQRAMQDASSARDTVPLEELQRIAEAVLKSLKSAEQQFAEAADKLRSAADDEVHSNEQELKNRKREMEDMERRTLQQLARGANAVERSHAQRVQQAENATRNAESQFRNAQRQRETLEKQLKQQPDNAARKQQLADADAQAKMREREHALALSKQASLKARQERAKQTQVEMAARKPTEIDAKNPTAELASRLAQNAAQTSGMIAKELQQSLEDTGWMAKLAAAESQLQSSGETQQRIEQAVGAVAQDLERAARHEQRLEHPEASHRIAQQAALVGDTNQREVHAATETVTRAAEQARTAAASQAPARATPEASLAAREAVSEAEGELRSRATDLQTMIEQAPAEEPSSSSEPVMPPVAPPVPLDPKMLARMLDELDRQMSSTENEQQDASQQSQSSEGQNAGKSQDDNNQAEPQQNSQGGKKGGSQTASMQQAARQLSQQMSRQRAQGRQSTASSRMASNSVDTKPAPKSAVRVLSVDRRSEEDWGKLREQSAEQTVESARQTIAPQYRQPVETYFRVLSERGHRSKQP